MADFVKNEHAKEPDDNGDGQMESAAGHLRRDMVDAQGPVLMPYAPNQTAEDPDWIIEDDKESEEAYVYRAPEGGEEKHVIYDCEVKLPPDLVALASKMKKVTFEEIAEINKESGIFDVPIAELEGGINAIADLALKLVQGMDPLMVWNLARTRDKDIATTILDALLHEQFMPRMRQASNLSTASLKKLKFALLESLVKFFDVAYFFGEGLTPLKGDSRFAFRVSSAIQYEFRQMLVKGRIEHNRAIFALAAQIKQNRRNQHSSPTRNLEQVVELTPQRKTEVFIRGALELQKSGSMFEACTQDCQRAIKKVDVHFEQILQIRRGDRRRVQEYFEDNEDKSAGDLLRVLDECLEIRQSALYNDAFRRRMHYSAQGHNIGFLCDHLGEIQHELQQQEWDFIGHGQIYLR